MTMITGTRAALAAALLAAASPAAYAAQNAGSPEEMTAAQEVRTEIAEAMDAIGDYTAEQRDEALVAAEEAMAEADAEIDKIEMSLRENWADMSEEAREAAIESQRELREARYELSVRYGALQAGASDVWEDLKDGFAAAWANVSTAWDEAWDAAFNDDPVEEAADEVEEAADEVDEAAEETVQQ